MIGIQLKVLNDNCGTNRDRFCPYHVNPVNYEFRFHLSQFFIYTQMSNSEVIHARYRKSKKTKKKPTSEFLPIYGEQVKCESIYVRLSLCKQ